MKKALLTTALGLISFFSSYGQSYFSCDYRQNCDWNSVTEEYDKCGDSYEEASLFKINKDGTVITHTTDNIKSTYYINSKEYDKVNDIWIYDVTSDIGNITYMHLTRKMTKFVL